MSQFIKIAGKMVDITKSHKMSKRERRIYERDLTRVLLAKDDDELMNYVAARQTRTTDRTWDDWYGQVSKVQEPEIVYVLPSPTTRLTCEDIMKAFDSMLADPDVLYRDKSLRNGFIKYLAATVEGPARLNQLGRKHDSRRSKTIEGR